ncbi:BPSL0067 family protein [Agrobacterium rhizogenes]|nr:BPSL0067 family protein [Rhizobium rhizogenes]NTI96354.1 BPSL0067 family protein [Rhizobium rhizogenes]NTJ61080.1 BPSL0067 family protein [Rhizobium rhizogenes]OCJ23841.1 hypothetical protein A6U89_31770 [Agrobacterium sp. B133/95]
MSYLAPNTDAYMGEVVGNGQCVAYVRAAAGCPATSQWAEGAKVKGAKIGKGTAIATFQDGKYNNYTDGRSHAAIYLSQTAEGLVVHDQWNGQRVHERVIRFRNGATTPNNDGDALCVIEDKKVLARLQKATTKRLGGRNSPKPSAKKRPIVSAKILRAPQLESILEEHLGPLFASLLLIPRNGSAADRLPFDWQTAKQYYIDYCHRGDGNDCPDGEFPSDCTHFVCHGLSKTEVLVNLPETTCTNGVCIRVAELAAAFKNSAGKYKNVKAIGNLSQTKEGDFCFITSWFGLATDHVMVLAETITGAGGRVWGHTNPRCAERVDLTGQTLAVYRIESSS